MAKRFSVAFTSTPRRSLKDDTKGRNWRIWWRKASRYFRFYPFLKSGDMSLENCSGKRRIQYSRHAWHEFCLSLYERFFASRSLPSDLIHWEGNLKTDLFTADVINEHVKKSTRYGYERRNVTFIVWLFDNHIKYPNLLEQSFYGALLCSDPVEKSQWKNQGNSQSSDIPSKNLAGKHFKGWIW